MSNNEVRGLMVSIIGTDCTNNGVTSGKRHAVLVWPGMSDSARVFAPRDDMPLLEAEVDENPKGLNAGYLVLAKGEPRGPFGFAGEPRIVRVRVKSAGKASGMFGGHYVECSDSRYPFTTPVPVFDRYE